MYNIKTLLAAATMTVAMAAGATSVSAAPWDRHIDHRMTRHVTVHRPYVVHNRVVQVLRTHNYRVVANPFFVRGHYVVKSFNRRGRTVFVEINPYTGAFLGEFRI